MPSSRACHGRFFPPGRKGCDCKFDSMHGSTTSAPSGGGSTIPLAACKYCMAKVETLCISLPHMHHNSACCAYVRDKHCPHGDARTFAHANVSQALCNTIAGIASCLSAQSTGAMAHAHSSGRTSLPRSTRSRGNGAGECKCDRNSFRYPSRCNSLPVTALRLKLHEGGGRACSSAR
jgi:hypothetical protein